MKRMADPPRGGGGGRGRGRGRGRGGHRGGGAGKLRHQIFNDHNFWSVKFTF